MCTPHAMNDRPACHACITTLLLVCAQKSLSLLTCKKGEVCFVCVRQRREYVRKCVDKHAGCLSALVHVMRASTSCSLQNDHLFGCHCRRNTSCHSAMQARLHAIRAWVMYRISTGHCAPCTPLASPSAKRSHTRRPLRAILLLKMTTFSFP